MLRAYQLLVEEKEPQKEKGYVGALYGNIKRCLLDKHLHLQAKTDYIAHLIARAEPELLGNHRERHAKTLEIAQEEVNIAIWFISLTETSHGPRNPGHLSGMSKYKNFVVLNPIETFSIFTT